MIRFGTLEGGVSEEVAELMKAAGRGESEQRVCVPFAGRNLRAEIAQAAR